jgi:hypothetical protein
MTILQILILCANHRSSWDYSNYWEVISFAVQYLGIIIIIILLSKYIISHVVKFL